MKMNINDMLEKALVGKIFVRSTYMFVTSTARDHKIIKVNIEALDEDLVLRMEFEKEDGCAIMPMYVYLDEEFEIKESS